MADKSKSYKERLKRLIADESREAGGRLQQRAMNYGDATRALIEDVGGPATTPKFNDKKEEFKKVQARPHNRAARGALKAGIKAEAKGKSVDTNKLYKKIKKKLEKRYPILKLVD